MDIETVKEILNVIEKIKTPLSFWSLIVIVFGFVFYTGLKESVPYKDVIQSIVAKLSKNGLFGIIRLLIIWIGVTILLFTVLAFCAPLISSFIDKHYDVSYLEKKFKDTQIDFEINKKYVQIIKYYEKHDYEKADFLLRETFPENDLKSETDRLGLVVATYYAAHQFDKAAEEVIKRGLKLPFWNTEIKNDLAHCIRNYRLETTPNEAIDLVKKLNQKYNYPKSLSYFWICLPMEVIDNIQAGIHSLSSINDEDLEKNDKEVLNFLIRKHPDDPFIDWAYYYNQDYDQALTKNGQIKDVLIYAKGYRIIKELRMNSDDVGNEDFLKKNLSPTENIKINDAISLFKIYIRDFPKLPHADDSSYWLSYLYIVQKKYLEALNELTSSQNLGNEDYNFYKHDLFKSIISKKVVSPEKLAYYINRHKILSSEDDTFELINSFFNSNITNNSAIMAFKNTILVSNKYVDLYLRYKLFENKFINSTYSDAIEKEGNNILSQIENILAENSTNENEDSDNYHTYLFEEVKEKMDSILEKYKFVKPIYTNKSTNLSQISKTASLIRIDHKDYDLSISLTQYGLKKFPGQNSDYLHYLKIMALKDKYTSQVEEEVKQFVRLYPRSLYLDDVLSECIYVKSYVQNEPYKADSLITLLFKMSPNGNARDNALYWIIEGYKNLCDCGIKNNLAYCQKAKLFNNKMKKEFSLTKYRLIAVKNQVEIEDDIKYINSEECKEYSNYDEGQ